jgi:hypothetical protein
MRLELGIFPVTDVVLSDRTAYLDGIVHVDGAALRDLLLEDVRLADIRFDVVHPGDAVRITTVRDQVEPRVKVEGQGSVYPGISGRPVETVGAGRTNVLRGMSIFEVTNTVWYNGGDGDVETYIDMWGPGGAATPFGSLHNLCMSVTPTDGAHIEEQNEAIHGAVLRAADLIAETTRGLTPESVEVSDLTKDDPTLSRVAYVMAMRSPEHYSASLHAHWTAIYGITRLTPPWLLNPNELFDGAVSGRASWELVNNPVAWGLAQRHGKELNFAGVITIRTRWSSQREKFLTAQQVASLCLSLRVDGVVVSWDSGGNDFMEVIRTIEACEKAGIDTVFLTPEESPVSGGPPLLEPLPEADAIVTTGFHGAGGGWDGRRERLHGAGGVAAEIPVPERVIGRTELHRVDPTLNEYVKINAAGPLSAIAWADRYGYMKASAFEY